MLEIDIGRMGGVVTREEFSRLVVDEIAGKRWLYHPALWEEEQSLVVDMRLEADRVEKAHLKRKALQDVSPGEWGRRYLHAFHQRWLEQLKVNEGGDSQALFESQRAATEAIEALAIHGYLVAHDADREPLRTIISRILSIRLGTGIEYKYDNAWSVINAILCDLGTRSLRWHTLYLIAARVYKPALTATQRKKVVVWREEVKASIKDEANLYVRDTTYDRLLGLLFPEMRPALNHPFGTPLYIVKQDYDVAVDLNQPKALGELELDKALLRESGAASGMGSPPISFSQKYAISQKSLSAEQILHRLIYLGVAKSKRDWS